MESGKDTEITDEDMLIARAKDAHVQSDAYAVGLSRSISIARRVGGFFVPASRCAPRRTTVCVGTPRCFFNQRVGQTLLNPAGRGMSSRRVFSRHSKVAPARAPNQTHGRAGVFSMVALVAVTRESPGGGGLQIRTAYIPPKVVRTTRKPDTTGRHHLLHGRSVAACARFLPWRRTDSRPACL